MGRKKVKVKKTGRIIIVLILIAVLGVLSYDYFGFGLKDSKEKKTVKKEIKRPEDYEAKIFMVGDSLIHSSVYQDAHQADGSYDFKPMLEGIKPISSKYDLAYFNQETILGGKELGLSNYPRFNSPTEVGDAFIDAGFNMVSLATNHTMDKGEQGVINSVNYWKTKKDIMVYSGQWISNEEREAEVAQVYVKNGIKYAFISYTIWNNGLSTPYGKDYLNSEYTPEKAAHDIGLVRDKVDFVIVAMHWGTEYSFKVDADQEKIANYLSSLGVDLIIGAHPHVIQTIEYINENKTFVVYSLGNFISDQNDVDNFTGLAFEVTLHKHIDIDDSVTNTIEDPKGELVYTTTVKRGGVNHNFKVVPYPQLSDEQLPNHASYYERYKAIVNERYPNLTWGLTWE